MLILEKSSNIPDLVYGIHIVYQCPQNGHQMNQEATGTGQMLFHTIYLFVLHGHTRTHVQMHEDNLKH